MANVRAVMAPTAADNGKSRLEKYVEMVQGKIDTYWKVMEFNFSDPHHVTVEVGRR